jgi:glutamate synthase domain-containing protein 2
MSQLPVPTAHSVRQQNAQTMSQCGTDTCRIGVTTQDEHQLKSTHLQKKKKYQANSYNLLE